VARADLDDRAAAGAVGLERAHVAVLVALVVRVRAEELEELA
jgi:hypothetical protein